MSSELRLVDVRNKSILPRSGHKIVVDDKYLYVLGGYVERNNRQNHEVRGEIWRYHFVFKTWEKCVFDNELFTLGASHSAVKIGDCIFITGGTGYPFGVNILQSLIVIDLKKMTQKIYPFSPKYNKSKNLPIATYGHTMTYVYLDKTPYLFIIGGTTGDTYHQEVYQINLISLESELVSDDHSKDCPGPRYKHEAFLYGEDIYVMGGATGTEFCYSFNDIHIFNVHTRAWRTAQAKVPIQTSPRCPSMAQNGRYVYLTGGYPSSGAISDSVHQLDLSDLSWTPIGLWRSPSYFHDSAFVPQLGALFLFGGVHQVVPAHRRNNDLFELRPATGVASRTLEELAWAVVLAAVLGGGEGPLCGHLLALGVPGALVARATAQDGPRSRAA